jgi:hypothetical protein
MTEIDANGRFQHMKYLAGLAAGALAMAALTTSAGAAPLTGLNKTGDVSSAVEHVQAWRYERGCAWNGRGWFYTNRGRVVVCRPPSPGPGYIWFSQGPRQGWYHPRRKAWYNNKW